jgi:hypothetical protein
MVAKGNVDKHRYTYSTGVKAVEEQKWGRDTAARRYGELKRPDTRPPDRSEPQFKTDQRGLDWKDDHPKDWVRGFGKGGIASAEGRPNFQPGYRPGKK